MITLDENTTNCLSTTITKETSSNVDTCVVNVPLGFTIGIGDEFVLNDISSTLLFTGIVQSIKTSGNKEVTVYDYGVQLQNRIVNDIYTNKTPEYIIEDIVSTYTDMTYVSTITSSATITSYVIKDKTAWDVIVDLIEVLNASFRVDKNKNFYLEIIEEDTSSETITTTNAVIDEDWDEVSDSLVNKITLIGDKQLFEKTESFNGTGSLDTFALSEFPVDVNVTVGGTEQTGYVEGASTTADYSVDKATKSIVFESGSIPTSGTNNVVIRYTFSIDIKLQSQDNDSISSYGIKEKKITKSYITSFQEARRYSNYYLGIYAKPLLTSTWIINDYTKFESFVPNQIIPVNDSIRSITGNYIIKSVEREFPGNLKVSVGWKEDDILDWAKETQYRVKQLEETDDNSTILQLYDFIVNSITVNVNSTLDKQLYRDLPDNYLYYANTIPDLENWWKSNNNTLDGSDSRNPLTWSGTASYDTGHHFINCFDLDGTNYVYADNISSSITKEKGSLSFWFKPTEEQYTGIFQLGDNTPSFYIDTDSLGIVWEGATGLPISDEYFTEVSLTIGNWYHIYLEWEDGVDITLYINDTLQETASAPVLSDIGSTGIGSDYDFIGLLEDIRLYSEKLSSDDRSVIYNDGDGLTSNARIYEIGNGENRTYNSTYVYADKDYWGLPDEELNHLELWLKMNGNAVDSSASSNDGTWVGTEQYEWGNQYPLSAKFDGSSYIEVTGIDLISKGDFTLYCWVKTTSTGNYDWIYSFGNSTISNEYMGFGTDGLGRYRAQISDDSGSNITLVSNVYANDSLWHLLCLTYDSSDGIFTLYIDDVQKDFGTKDLSSGFSALNTTVVGALKRTSVGNHLIGLVGDVGFNNILLNSTERTKLYNNGDGITTNPVPNYSWRDMV